jgi:hypothetical protein
MPRLCRRLLFGSVSLAAAFALMGGAGGGLGASQAPDPSSNIVIAASGIPGVCSTKPTGLACESAAVTDLDAARAHMALGPYLLPGNFVSLPATAQLFILTNLDRLAYGVDPLVGLSARIDAAAAHGVLTDSDPTNPPDLPSATGWSSNWAGGFQNALFAYYTWVYADGRGSGNLDCTARDHSGCWGHRNNIIDSQDTPTASMGDAVGSDRAGTTGYALEIANPLGRLTYTYTWAEARKDGSGARPGAIAVAKRTAPTSGEAPTRTTAASPRPDTGSERASA